jgi:acetyl-CoA acetyltransferase
MPKHPFHGVAVVGAFNTVQARTLPDHTSRTITLDAIRGALADAGLSIKDLDGVNVTFGTSQEAGRFVYEAGLRHAWTGAQRLPTAAVLEAAAAIATGQCHTVLVANGQAGVYTERASTAPWTRPDNEFVECWGLYTAAEFALIARRHMVKYGTTPEQLATVAAQIRNNGHVFPEAVYYSRGPYTVEDILNSRMVADPYHLLDCSTTSEGACAVILTTAERARDLEGKPAYLLGGALDTFGQAYTFPPAFDLTGWVGRAAAQKAFGMAGLGPDNVDVCEFYDPFSFEIIRQFEAYGFCGEGEGGPFVQSGVIALDGRFPICTDGGTMSHSHTGTSQILQKVVQCVRQVRGASPANQIPDAHVAMTSTSGAGAMNTPVLLFGDHQP